MGNVDECDDGVGEGDFLCLVDIFLVVRMFLFLFFFLNFFLLRDLVLGGSLGFLELFEGVLLLYVLGLVEFELRVFADDCRSFVREFRLLFEYVFFVLVVFCLEVFFGRLFLVFDLFLELKNLNLFNIEFLLVVIVFFWEVFLFEAEEFVEVVFLVLIIRFLLFDLLLERGCVKFRFSGIGIFEVVEDFGEVVCCEVEGVGLLLMLFLVFIKDEFVKSKNIFLLKLYSLYNKIFYVRILIILRKLIFLKKKNILKNILLFYINVVVYLMISK